MQRINEYQSVFKFLHSPGANTGDISAQKEPILGLELQKSMKNSPNMYLLVQKQKNMVR
jgi:hypothetical protein